MVNAKVKVLGAQYYLFGLDFASGIETDLLLNDICALTIGIDDIRDIKIDNILKNPL